MKVNSKIGDSYRVIIPKEIRDILNIEKYQPITLEVDDLGRIIIDLKCGRTETGLVKNTLNIESLPKGARYWENGVLKVKLDEPIKEEKPKKVRKKKEKITIKIEPEKEETILDKFNKSDELEFIKPKPLSEYTDDELIELKFCPKCDGVVEPDSFVRVNGKYICRSCINDLKTQLKKDVVNM